MVGMVTWKQQLHTRTGHFHPNDRCVQDYANTKGHLWTKKFP